MANQHLGILKQGAEVWNKWKKEKGEVYPYFENVDLSQLNLGGAHLYKASFTKVNLSGANLSKAFLAGATFLEVNLSHANLSHSTLSSANILRTNLREADLSQALIGEVKFLESDLYRANLREANLGSTRFIYGSLVEAALFKCQLHGADFHVIKLQGADFDKAVMGNTVFSGVDLSQVKGLDSIFHVTNSFIDVFTIYISKGNILEKFLRNIGIPQNFITYMRSIAAQPIQFYSCFISYASKDQSFADRLYADLQTNSVRCWFAPEDLKIGAEIRTGIDESINVYDKLLLVLSETSVKSQWVQQEVETALAKEREHGRTVLFPIRLDDVVMHINTGWPAYLKNTRNIGDFTRWKEHDPYQKAFKKLLNDLKAEEKKV